MIPSTNQYGVAARPTSSSWVVNGRSATPLASVLAHKRWAFAIVAILSLAGLVAALLVSREYLAEATIRVSPVLPTSLDAGPSPFASNLEYRDFVQEQVFEIDNYANVSEALDSLGPKRSLWQQPGETDRHATERLMWMLKVEPVADSYLVKIGLTGGQPQ